VNANQYGALNMRSDGSVGTIDFMPLQDMQKELKILDGDKVVYNKEISFKPLTPFTYGFKFEGNTDNLTITIGGNKLVHHMDPKEGLLSRPVRSPEDIHWDGVFGLYTQGKELLQQ